MRTVLDDFVRAFNALDAKAHLHTPQREEIRDSYLALTRQSPLPLPSELAEQWFDALRAF